MPKDAFQRSFEFRCSKCGAPPQNSCILLTGKKAGEEASTPHNERLNQGAFAVEVYKSLDLSTDAAHLAIIEEQQAKYRMAFDRMVWLNELHYDVKYPGKAKSLGIK